jgi:hypothetical protein
MTALALAAAFCMTQTASLDNRFDDALGVAGLSTKTARFDPGILSLYAQGEFESLFFRALNENPWRTPFYMEMNRRLLAESRLDPAATVSTLSRLTGEGSRRSLLANPIARFDELAAKEDAMVRALQALKSDGVVSEAPTSVAAPAEVQRATALLLYAALDLVRYRRAAFADVRDLEEAYSRETTVQPSEDDPQVHQELVAFYRTVEMNYMYAVGQDLAAAVARAQEIVQNVPATEKYGVQIETLWGRIVLSGGSDSQHQGDGVFILIDTGGNDVYTNAPTNDSVSNWLSVVVDSYGDDKYVSDPALATASVASWEGRKGGRAQPGPCSALFGFSFLNDSRGSDTYRSHRTGLGAASFGVAMLTDKEGNDVYDSYADGQGYGKFGIGILEDHAGNDRYMGFTQVQGVGLIGGVGALLDRAGDDVYAANDTVIDFPSPQSAQHNVSMAQGAGYGLRHDYLSGHSLSGGFGLLYDQAGKDAYSCGVFGQGTGYWQGVGALWDEKGDDTYFGMWYVQGAAAHFAHGYLEDLDGADTYSAEMNMAQGAGHDFSVGYLIDRAGNDVHTAPNLSLGAGNSNGIGIFVDMLGVDRYTSSGLTLGKASDPTRGSVRERALCLGVFMDLDGNDVFPAAATWAKNGARVANWTDRGPFPAESHVGVFWDGDR